MPIPLSVSLSAEDLSELEAFEGATRLRMPAGQVLVYREHRSPGLFVLLSGRIEVPEEKGQRRPSPHRAEAQPGRPVLLPRTEAIDERFTHTWAVADTADVIYLPRTLVHDDESLKTRLSELATG